MRSTELFGIEKFQGKKTLLLVTQDYLGQVVP